MIPPLQAIRRVLWGNIVLDGKKIPVVKQGYPYDKSPCVTIDDSGGSVFVDRWIGNVEYPLPVDHPQYDAHNPFKMFPQQVLREYYETTVNIHVWANTEDEREQLNNIVSNLVREAQSDHYKFCDNYHDGECTSMGTGCYTEHFNKINSRLIKHQCPKPELYGYKNIFTTYNLIRASFYLNQPYNLNDYSKDSTMLRSVLKLHTGYYTDHIIGGIVSDNVVFKGDII